MHLGYFIPLILALPCHSLFILLPLYLYPSSNASAWSNVTDAIAANPTVDWQIIVNPNSGPGTYPPDANYILALAKLNSYPNVRTLGYVATGYSQVPPATLTAQIDVYAQWNTYTAANISVRGIFFDEVDNTAAEAVYAYYKNAADYAHSKTPSTVIFNPGAPAPKPLFAYAETIVQFEQSFSNYKDAATIAGFTSGFNDQTAIIVHSTPSSADVGPLVQTMAEARMQAVYFGADCCYNAFDGELLSSVAEAVAAAGV
ncbi:MAG: hypothetical protein Q9169_005988 [Polycauliona sp. 2 TL-2023]